MKVIRTELLEFTLVMSKNEFDVLCKVSDNTGISLENVVLGCYLTGLHTEQHNINIKECRNELERKDA